VPGGVPEPLLRSAILRQNLAQIYRSRQAIRLQRQRRTEPGDRLVHATHNCQDAPEVIHHAGIRARRGDSMQQWHSIRGLMPAHMHETKQMHRVQIARMTYQNIATDTGRFVEPFLVVQALRQVLHDGVSDQN
jgi:hypothetical protein